jgi:hypothetical protein
MAADAQAQDRFGDVIAELNNVLTSVFGLAYFLAHGHDQSLMPTLERELARYKALAAELVEIHRGARPS